VHEGLSLWEASGENHFCAPWYTWYTFENQETRFFSPTKPHPGVGLRLKRRPQRCGTLCLPWWFFDSFVALHGLPTVARGKRTTPAFPCMVASKQGYIHLEPSVVGAGVGKIPFNFIHSLLCFWRTCTTFWRVGCAWNHSLMHSAFQSRRGEGDRGTCLPACLGGIASYACHAAAAVARKNNKLATALPVVRATNRAESFSLRNA